MMRLLASPIHEENTAELRHSLLVKIRKSQRMQTVSERGK